MPNHLYSKGFSLQIFYIFISDIWVSGLKCSFDSAVFHRNHYSEKCIWKNIKGIDVFILPLNISLM